MSLERHIGALRALIDKKLDAYLPKESPGPRAVHKAMRYSVFSEGKRIRPILVIESSRVCAGRLRDAVTAACAVEFIHTYSLVHDDLPSMDDDDYRRGKPSCHKAFGEANAILAGDALLTLAFEIIARDIKSSASSHVIRELAGAAGIGGMVAGQALDIEFSRKRAKDKDAGALDCINRLKTAKLFEASAKLGAITALAAENKINAMAAYGASFGMAFQIADDIIDGEGYAALFGRGKALADSRELIGKAKRALRIFGAGAAASRLIDMADYVLERASGKTDR